MQKPDLHPLGLLSFPCCCCEHQLLVRCRVAGSSSVVDTARLTTTITTTTTTTTCNHMGSVGQQLNRLAYIAVGLGGGLTLLNYSMYNVDAGERAVIWDRFRGILNETRGEGTHFLIPGIQRAQIIDIRTRPRNIQTTTGTKDLQMVNLTMRVLSKPESEQLPRIIRNLGADYDERVLPSIGNEVMKAVVAQYDAGELITRREMVSLQIREQLMKRAREFNINLDDISIVHLTFGSEFINAVERKSVAQQEAERSRYIVARAEHEREAAIVRAEGESESARLISEAIKRGGKGFVELRRIEAAREIAGTLARSRNITYLPPTSNVLMNLPTN